MSNRTWACVPCGKTYRRIQSVRKLDCPDCGEECECLPWKMRVPPASHRPQWLAFWKQYRHEKRLLAAHLRGEDCAGAKLTLLNMDLAKPPKSPSKAQRSAGKWKHQKRRADAAKNR